MLWNLEGKEIDFNSETFIIGEIGANHNGDLETAKKIIDIAKGAKVNAVKFQTYTADTIVSDKDRIITWGHQNKVRQKIGQMFSYTTLGKEYYPELFEYARKLELIPFSTPFDIEGVEFLEKLGVSLYKIASSDVGNIPLLREVARTGKPVIISTGKSTFEEIDLAIRTIEKMGNNQIAILHCVAAYPTKVQDSNIQVMLTLKRMYPEYVVGFSDHSQGYLASCIAITHGAKIIEKHITYDKNSNGPDHWFSLDEAELIDLVENIRISENIMGDGRKRIVDSEKEGRKYARPSIVAKEKIFKGQVIKGDMLKIIRPGYGIEPKYLDLIIGRVAREDINENELLRWEHI